MPRPSLKAERREMILDAMERCVIRDGVNGATLERIAEEAGMRRSLLRHNIGNREQLIEALLERFIEQSDLAVQWMQDHVGKTGKGKALLNVLFDESDQNHQLTLLGLSLTAASSGNEMIRQRMKQWNEGFVTTMDNQLKELFPKSTRRHRQDVAAGLVGIYFNVESLSVLGDLTEIRKASKRAASQLLSSLGEDS